MNAFYGINFFIFIFALFLLVAALFAVRAIYSYTKLEKDASDDWDYKVSQNMHDPHLDKSGYINAYKRAYAPRREAYIATTLTLITLLTPAVLAALSAFLYWLWRSDQADGEETRVIVRGVDMGGLTYEPGNMVFGFIAFFGILALWTGIVAIAVRRYYRLLPGPLRDEILRERAK